MMRNKSHNSDDNFHYLVNAQFTPLDMTDHEDSFVGWHEVGGEMPINRLSWLNPLKEEPFRQTDMAAASYKKEKRPLYMTHPSAMETA